jgi:hypothetical protein
MQLDHLRRREFITLVAGAAFASLFDLAALNPASQVPR